MQVEAFLRRSAEAEGNERMGQAKVALLGVLAEVILDPGTPSICSPYLTSLFQNAVSRELRAHSSDQMLPVCFTPSIQPAFSILVLLTGKMQSLHLTKTYRSVAHAIEIGDIHATPKQISI